MTTINHLDEVVHRTRIEDLIILGDLNVNMDKPKDERAEDIVNTIETYEMRNLMKQFRPKQRNTFNWSWSKFREGKEVRALCDYILFGKNIKWKSSNMVKMNFDSDHRLLQGKLIVKKG